MKSTKRIALQVFIFQFMAVISAMAATEIYEPMPGPGKKAQIGKDYTAVYTFDKRPQMGTVIMRLEVFDKEGKKDSSLKITGNLDMPTMKGAHGSGDNALPLNKKGEYIMALNLVMPGEWELQLVFSKDNKVIHRGSIRIHV